MQEQIFSDKAMKKLKTADDLEQYIRLTNPGAWLILGASLALLIGLIVWAFFGTAATTVEARAAVINGEMHCFISSDEYKLIKIGDPAYINHTPWIVSDCSSMPISKEAAYELIGSDFLYYELITSNTSYQVTLVPAQGNPDSAQTDLYGLKTADVVIHTRSVHPIDLILNG